MSSSLPEKLVGESGHAKAEHAVRAATPTSAAPALSDRAEHEVVQKLLWRGGGKKGMLGMIRVPRIN
jgi:hypothetical protein